MSARIYKHAAPLARKPLWMNEARAMYSFRQMAIQRRQQPPEVRQMLLHRRRI